MKNDLFIISSVIAIYFSFGLIDRWLFIKLGKVNLKLISLIGVNFLVLLIEFLLIAFTWDNIELSGSYIFYFYGVGYFIVSLILKLLIFKRLALKALITSSIVMTVLFLGAFLLIVEYKIFEK